MLTRPRYIRRPTLKALEAEIAIPIAYCLPSHMVLVGDPNQLSPTLLSQKAKNSNRGTSTMERLITQCGKEYHLLNVQYRMHPEIMKFPNAAFYDQKLLNDKSVVKRGSLFSIPLIRSNEDSNLLPWLRDYSFINVDGNEKIKSRINPSISNSEEAEAIVR